VGINKSENSMEERIIFNSLGLLSKEEKDILDSEIDNSSDDERNEFMDFNNLTSLFSKLLSIKIKDVSLSESLKERLFEKINIKENSNTSINNRKKEKNNFGFIYSDSSEWSQYPVEGIKFKLLSLNQTKGYLMLLFKADPGSSYPSHHHTSAEECYVIEGDLCAEGKVLGPGDFHHAEAGSDHGQLYTKNGCTLLLVVDPADYL